MGSILDCAKEVWQGKKGSSRQADFHQAQLEKDQDQSVIIMADINQTYNIPLRKEFQKAPRYKRAKKAMTALRLFVERHMKSDDIKLSPNINNFVWKHGIKNPPHHVKVNIRRDKEGVVFVEMAELDMDKFVKSFAKKEKKEEKTAMQEKMDRLKNKMGASAKKESKDEEEAKPNEKKQEKKEEKQEDKAKPKEEQKSAKIPAESKPSTPAKTDKKPQNKDIAKDSKPKTAKKPEAEESKKPAKSNPNKPKPKSAKPANK